MTIKITWNKFHLLMSMIIFGLLVLVGYHWIGKDILYSIHGWLTGMSGCVIWLIVLVILFTIVSLEYIDLKREMRELREFYGG